jgi:hypothetical protein
MRSPFVTGLLHPLNLLMLVLAIVAGLLAAWWLFPLGLVLWVVMVITVSRDPSLRISHTMHSRDPLARRFQPYFDRIERAQISVFNSLASAPSQTRKVLQPVQEELEVLTSSAYQLCRRMTALENYRLVADSTSDLSAELQQVNEAIDRAGDPRVRQEYEESRRSLVERIARVKLATTELDRVEAQLLGLSNEMDGLVAEVIRLQAAGPAEAERQILRLLAELRSQSGQLETSDQDTIEP